MLIKISNNTLGLIKKEVLPSLKINGFIQKEDVYRILEYFSDKEVYLSQNINDGIAVDKEYLKLICMAVDELNVDYDKNIDLFDLNQRLSII